MNQADNVAETLDTDGEGIDGMYDWVMSKPALDEGFEKDTDQEQLATLPKRLLHLKSWSKWRLIFSCVMSMAFISFIAEGFSMIHPENMKDEYDTTYILALVSGSVLGFALGQVLQVAFNSLMGAFWFKSSYRNELLLLKYYYRCENLQEENRKMNDQFRRCGYRTQTDEGENDGN